MLMEWMVTMTGDVMPAGFFKSEIFWNQMDVNLPLVQNTPLTFLLPPLPLTNTPKNEQLTQLRSGVDSMNNRRNWQFELIKLRLKIPGGWIYFWTFWCSTQWIVMGTGSP